MSKVKKLTKLQKEHGIVLVPETEYLFNEKQKYLLGKIRISQILNYERDTSAFVPINAKTLESIIGRYQPTIKSLIDLGIITSNPKYFSGWRSRTYSFMKNFKFKRHYLKEKWMLLNIKAHKEKFIPKTSYIKFLFRNLKKVRVDIEKAMKIIENDINYQEIIEHSNKRHRTKKGRKREHYFSQKEYQQLYKDKIKILDMQDYYFKVDDTAGRIHTNISSLKRELRSSLFYKGKPLYELDCANSQNFLFNILIKQFFRNFEAAEIFSVLCPVSSSVSSLYSDILTQIYYFKDNIDILLAHSRRECQKNNINSIESIVYKKSKNIKNLTDVVHYFYLTSKGVYWQFLMEKDKFTGNKSHYKQTSFGKVFFCQKPRKNKWKERKTFEKYFPNVAKIIDFYKREDYRQLPILMQKTEADIIIHTIIKRIHREKPNMFVLTNHDAIYCTRENVSYVMKVMLDSYYRAFKFRPTIKISPPLV